MSRDDASIMLMILSIKPILRQCWIYVEFPAVTFEIDQQISFLIAFLGWSKRWINASKTPESMATCAYSSLAVRILPRVRKQGTAMMRS